MIPVAEAARKAVPAVETDEAPATVAGVRYRADIDGLRALAVIAVVLTHAGFGGFAGGFVGVDIFFVISGYLIYRDLVARLDEGRFSLSGFYGRRMRRTLPALYLVATATMIAAAFIIMPGDLDALARSLIATVLLVPNVFFLTQNGYFDGDAITKPLLHTWSLGVEEQFYLLAPVLPFALRGLPRTPRRSIVLILLAIGLCGCVAIRGVSRDAAFYLMPARIFEFLVGALVVEGVLPHIRQRWHAEATAAAALATLLGSILVFGKAIPHPGLVTLVPCLATALIIHVGIEWRTRTAGLLGWRPIAFIGLISYSIYLWHWPILVLARYAEVPQTLVVMLAEAAVLLMLSFLSWRFVETPFRKPGTVWRRRAPLLLPTGAGALVSACLLVGLFHGFPGRFPTEVASVADYYAYRDRKPFREGKCFITSKDNLRNFDRALCLRMTADKPNVLLIGDSHGAHLWAALRDAWPEVNVLQATASGCKPVVGTAGASRCVAMMRDMLERFIPEHRLDAVVIGAHWQTDDLEPLKQTIAAIEPFVGRIVVFGPVPRYDTPAATLIAKAMLRGRLESVQDHVLPDAEPLDAAMRVAIAPIATYVSPYEILCPEDRCRLFAAPGVPMQFDYHHLTPAGSDLMMAEVRKRFPHLLDRNASSVTRPPGPREPRAVAPERSTRNGP